MAENGNNDLDYQERSGNLTNSSSSGMHIATTTMNSIPFRKSSNGVDLIFSTGWNPAVSLSENEEFKSSEVGSHNPAVSPYSVGMFGNHGTCSDSHILRYPLDPNLLERPPNLSSFGSGSFSAMVSSFGLPEYDQATNASCPDYPSTEETGFNLGKAEDRGTMVQGDLQIMDEGGSGSSPDGKKRKGVPDYYLGTTHSHFQNGEAEQRRGVSQESTEGLQEQDGKKQKTEKNSGLNSRGKSTGKQAKDSSQNEQSSKEDYIHVRARRGQATNSHSLAERVRREKISQRMKYLQDLVPGCDKITGKALMLDEIINYVQSLQCQVEFLSMKLAAVNPQLNIDMDRIMPKDILHSQVGGSAILGFGLSSTHSQPPMSSQGTVQAIHGTNSHLQPGSQMPTIWDDDLQNMFQMGLKSSPTLDSVGLNGKVGATNPTS